MRLNRLPSPPLTRALLPWAALLGLLLALAVAAGPALATGGTADALPRTVAVGQDGQLALLRDVGAEWQRRGDADHGAGDPPPPALPGPAFSATAATFFPALASRVPMAPAPVMALRSRPGVPRAPPL
ncbi:hypothetical protein [Alloalcanivorax mobilis]|uniref:hypothetical protein n=1 Tax=Alloalcanivorax mobilis TaxID=2019569 RepID=UPI000B5B2EB0|nr:hypothetical protein [Alloalcanivorax mobilis]ASK33981.1 hypothetical protein CEK62_06080 [Alcanivorax sp. N3-2A]